MSRGCWRYWPFSFAVVAILLGGAGLYGVLDYSVLQQRREIGIRIAIGAGSAEIARRVATVVTGALAGIALGARSSRSMEPMLYQVHGSDFRAMASSCVAILTVAFVATLPVVTRAVRIDPITMLRME